MSEAMNIQNRSADVKKLCTNALQDFLKLVIKADWKNDFYNICNKNCPKGKYCSNYSGAYEKILEDGLEKYDIRQMDITLICVLLEFNTNLLNYKLDDNTLEIVRFLRESRNFESHLSTNEEDEELYMEALIYLYKMKMFLKSIIRSSKIPKTEEKMKFYQKYIKNVSELMFKIDDERFELVAKYKQFQKDVDQILNARNENKYETYSNICESYRAKSIASINNRHILDEFNAYAYERGVDYAKDASLLYYDWVHDFKKFNLIYKSDFHKLAKKDREEFFKEVMIYLMWVNEVRKKVKEPLDESFYDCFETIEKLGFKIVENEKGVYTLADSDNKVQSSDK